MANICDFTIKVKGKTEEALETFFFMMKQEGDVHIGRGAEINDYEIIEDGGFFYVETSGTTKWSIEFSLINSVADMRENASGQCFEGASDNNTVTFVTLFEACEQLGIDMECYAETLDSEIQEHLLFKDGEIVEYETSSCTYEYIEEDDDYVMEGGYESWSFEI